MTPKQINALSARIARLETLLEDKDAFSTGGGTSAGEGFSYQGSQFGGISFGDNYFQTQGQDGSGFGGIGNEWNLDQQLEDNYGFGPTEATINELMGRIAELELLTAGGSRDTQQDGALNAGQDVGDDKGTGTGDASAGDAGVPEGYGPIEISICDNGTSRTMNVLGTTPV